MAGKQNRTFAFYKINDSPAGKIVLGNFKLIQLYGASAAAQVRPSIAFAWLAEKFVQVRW